MGTTKSQLCQKTYSSASLDRCRTDAAVDLDVEVGKLLPEELDLGHHVGHELLAAEPWKFFVVS